MEAMLNNSFCEWNSVCSWIKIDACFPESKKTTFLWGYLKQLKDFLHNLYIVKCNEEGRFVLRDEHAVGVSDGRRSVMVLRTLYLCTEMDLHIMNDQMYYSYTTRIDQGHSRSIILLCLAAI